MRTVSHALQLVLLALMLLLLFCSKKVSDPFMPVTSVVVGNVTLCRIGAPTHALPVGSALMVGDTIKVGAESKVKLTNSSGDAIYINENTIFIVSHFERSSDNAPTLDILMLAGEVYSSVKSITASKGSYSVSSPTATASIRGTDFDMSYEPSSGISSVMVLAGTVQVLASNEQSQYCQAGYKIAASETGITGAATLVTGEDIDHLKQWVGASAIEALVKTLPQAEAPASANTAPVWTRQAKVLCKAGAKFIDTITATDPEAAEVTYQIVSAPTGFALDSKSGIINYTPAAAGTYAIKVTATDAQGALVEMAYELTVAENSKLTAAIKMAELVKPGEAVSIEGVASRNAGEIKKLLYRFDVNGDGVWEYPAGDEFSDQSTISHSFTDEGVFTVMLEVKNNEGKLARAQRKITVKAPPVAKLSASPQVGAPGATFTFDASQSSNGTLGGKNLSYRFDLNGDGTFDNPDGGAYGNATTATASWQNTGTQRVGVEVKDEFGLTASAACNVVVSNGALIGSLAMADSCHVGDSVTITCKPQAGEFAVTTYAWNTDGDTSFERSGTTPSTSIRFKRSGTYTIACRITDEKGFVSPVVKRSIKVINSGTTVKAHCAQTARVKQKITFTGSATDPDNKITDYTWDFNGDGVGDYSSPSSGNASFVFDHAGTYKAQLSVKTDDGVVTTATTPITITSQAPLANAGPDITANRNQRVKFKGTATDPDSNITLYEWDFNADGTFDWKSPKNGTAELRIPAYTYCVLRVTDADGLASLDTMKVVICPEGMKTIKEGTYCIDEFEYPNKRDQNVQVNVTYSEAQKLCTDQGKRLCTATEWQFGCMGKDKKRIYPYGRDFQEKRCNTMGDKWNYQKIAQSGYFEECVSQQGLYDMSGNAAEWTAGATGATAYAYGGSWQNGKRGSECTAALPLDKTKKFFYVGVRCCK